MNRSTCKACWSSVACVFVLSLCLQLQSSLAEELVQRGTTRAARVGGGADDVQATSTTMLPGTTTGIYAWCNGGGPGEFNTSYSVTDNGAGHQHNDPGRPKGSLSSLSYRIDCDSAWHKVADYTAPQVSGLVVFASTINGRPMDTPPIQIAVQVPGLQRLPHSPFIEEIGFSAISEVLIKSPPHDHPDNHWGQPNLNSRIINLASQFYHVRNKKIRVNDMSLPQGGLLDFKNTWAPPHDTHRDGKHVDIQLRGAMDAEDQKAFRTIAESVFGARHVCIDGGGSHWHLVIEKECRDTTLKEWGYSASDTKQ